MTKIWVTGDAVVDLIPDTENSYLKCPGGAPANVAVAISRLGGDAGFFGRIGNDPLGRFLVHTLTEEKVDTTKLHLDEEHRTSTVVVDLDSNGERSFTFMVKPSADQFTTDADIPAFTADEWLHTCSIALANDPSRSATLEAMRRMKKVGGFVSFDPNLREEVWSNQDEIKPVVHEAITLADVVKFSEEELLFLTDTLTLETGIEALKAFNNTLALITQGAKGALVIFGGQQAIVPSKPVSPADTTGAGDAFVGGLLAKLSQSGSWQNNTTIQAAVIWANGCGALATTQKGAMTALPTQQALADFLSA
ncbi:aminoimidazole riboside kinase [Salinivibrio sp. IB643]|uniref:aminoimidazole riboside kinase n=1 Tax=Salinivibrio sp. IB643 TaxID=1909445 RepID=UPI000989681B|nr:aminoimidazole riboside kinase [Salinivibrio sp. IB643]OOE96085.1 aminoimidazole riboside kinase [Salinivibrio sp. IB643]